MRFFNGCLSAHLGWGLYSGAGPAGKVAAARDLEAFSPSLQLRAWKAGAWPVMLFAAQSDMSLERIANFPLGFAPQLPPDSSPPSVDPFQTDAPRRECLLADENAARARRGEAEQSDLSAIPSSFVKGTREDAFQKEAEGRTSPKSHPSAQPVKASLKSAADRVSTDGESRVIGFPIAQNARNGPASWAVPEADAVRVAGRLDV